MGLSVFDPGTPPGAQTIGLYGALHDAPSASAECLLLLKDSDATHPDPVKNISGSYKRGDIIEVLAPNKHDGNLVSNPIAAPFYLLRVVGVTKAQMQHFHYISRDVLVPENDRKRLYRVDIDALPVVVRTALTASRYSTISWATLRRSITQKLTGLTQ